MNENDTSASRHRPVSFLDEEKARACIHCGLCLGACPTYLETGNENDSPRGRIYLMRALQEGRLDLEDNVVRHLDLCLGCRACETACPSGVQYGALLESTRKHIQSHYRRSWRETLLRRLAIDQVFPFPGRLRIALLPARVARRLRLDRLLPESLRKPLALVPQRLRTCRLPRFSPTPQSPRKGRVGFIPGCVMRVMFSETNANSIALLNAAGYDVLIPRGQGCCGALDAHNGNMDRARKFARAMIQTFALHELDAIIINAAGCGSILKEYVHLLEDDPEWGEAASAFSRKVRDLSEWLVADDLTSKLQKSSAPFAVTYHDACHLAHPQRISEAPRQLVREVAGKHYVELPESEVCCGSAGTYNLTEPEMAEQLQQRKIENILATRAQVVVTTNPGCILQIQAGLNQARSDHVEVLHLADYLARHLPS